MKESFGSEGVKELGKKVTAIQREKITILQELASIGIDKEVLGTCTDECCHPLPPSPHDLQSQIDTLKAQLNALQSAPKDTQQTDQKQSAVKGGAVMSQPVNQPVATMTLLIGASILRHVQPAGLVDTDVRCLRGAKV